MKKIKKHPIFLFFLEVFLITLAIGGFIVILGAVRRWDSAVSYSNAFFIAGLLIFAVGAISRISAGQGLFNFPSITAESYKNLDVSDRMKFIISTNSPIRHVLLGATTGLLLILISLLASKV